MNACQILFGFCGKSGQYIAEKVLKSSHNNTEKV
jgi:hypothetical protein